MSEGTLDVSYVAELSRLKLSSDEIECFQKQLGDIVGYIQQLQKVDLTGVEEKGDAPDFKNNLRLDVVGESLPPAQALLNAPLKTENLLLVPKIVE